MTPEDLTEYLHRQIPLSEAMGVRVLEANNELVRLKAPLAPNINHQQTLFGGSGASILTLAAWTLVHLRLSKLDAQYELVIAEGAVRYKKPVRGEFEVVATSDEVDWSSFLTSLLRKGKGRTEVHTELFFEGQVCATFQGKFVAIKAQADR